MQEEQIRETLNRHWQASAAGDANAEHDIYEDDAICDYPQSGERILGRSNLQALRSHHPGKPSGFKVKRIVGNGDLWITEYTITYQGRPAFTVSIMEFRDGKVVHETQYFADPFDPPAWRSQWVESMPCRTFGPVSRPCRADGVMVRSRSSSPRSSPGSRRWCIERRCSPSGGRRHRRRN